MAITGTSKVMRYKWSPVSMMTHHSHASAGRYPWNVSAHCKHWSSVVHRDAIPENIWPSLVVVISTKARTKARTKWHVISIVVGFHKPCVECIPAVFEVPLYHCTRYHVNREKYNPYGWRTPVRPRFRVHHANSELMGNGGQLLLSLTSMDGPSLTCTVMRLRSVWALKTQ